MDWDFRIDRGRNSGEWGKIAVPSNWEFEGYGVFAYGQANGPDRPGWHELMPEVDATAVYRTTFTVPPDWGDRHVSIVFEGVMTDASVRINGQSAGPTHQGGFYEFSYPVTELLRQGQNELEVTVNNVSRNASAQPGGARRRFLGPLRHPPPRLPGGQTPHPHPPASPLTPGPTAPSPYTSSRRAFKAAHSGRGRRCNAWMGPR